MSEGQSAQQQYEEARERRRGQGGSNGGGPAAANLDEWDAGDDPGKIPPREWLLGNQFCRTFVSSKTALRMLQLISLATGQLLCGQHVFRRCRVLLISLER